ncbi:DNA repair protein RecN [Massilibacterium senegalense]|uniref:DNA repair protein RecN n=1 Tax=Massilibacterium senegalense TaxID=1632858 RepID=UPI000783CB50|nr:DNA repair protein RecN [Massilibacterium senegalense]
MLLELSIKNFAIIHQLTLSFEKGMTVLTGETGAGKSIIIDAIGLLAGGRGSFEYVRYGAKKAEIEGLFFVQEEHRALQICKQYGIDAEENTIILRRDISDSGKSICRINGKMVTIAILREVGQSLIDIHGQHEHQDLMQPERHLFLLDEYAKDILSGALEEYRQLFERYQKLTRRLMQLNENEQQVAQRIDLLQYQLEEIKKADLVPNEDEALFHEKSRLANYEKIFEGIHDAYNALYGDNRGLDWLSHAMSQLESISTMDEKFQQWYEQISNHYFIVEELTYTLRNELDTLEFDPNRLNVIESRLNEVNQLKRKYGESVAKILEYAAKIEDELDTLLHREEHVSRAQEECQEVAQDLILEAKNLTERRQQAAQQLIEDITQELKDLYMDKTRFDIRFEKVEATTKDPVIDGEHVHFTRNGIDRCEFLLSTNPGEPLKELAKVASGGELSRIMLALKSILSKNQGTTSIIFDEVDTGVSGRVAQSIAEKMYQLANGSQVLCITHLPQVAAMSDVHLYISKQEEKGRTKTKVQPLVEDEKIKEIGRMISGVEMTELTKQHAKELLDLANEFKKKTK